MGPHKLDQLQPSLVKLKFLLIVFMLFLSNALHEHLKIISTLTTRQAIISEYHEFLVIEICSLKRKMLGKTIIFAFRQNHKSHRSKV